MSHNNKKCVYKGFKFDSYAERDDYIYQCACSDVLNVIVKPKFILQEGFRNYAGHKIIAVTFTPDLLIKFNNNYAMEHSFMWEIRDTKPWNNKKGKFITEPVFKLKFKLLEYLVTHGESPLKYTSPSGDGSLNCNLVRFILTA